MWKNFIPNSTEEETINNAFCTNGMFKIASESEVTVYPKVQANVQNKRMMVYVDNTVILLQDENVMECNLLSFAAPIDALAVSQAGNVIVCALTDGNIHGIFIKGVPIFNLCIREEDVCESGSTFVGINQHDDSFFIMCRNGKIYKLSNVDEKLLDTYAEDTVCENETRLLNETILKNTTLERVTTTSLKDNITSFCITARELFNEKERTEVAFIMGSDRMIHFENGTEHVNIYIPEKFQGVKAIYNLEEIIVGLSNSGHIFEICPHTKLIFQEFGKDLDYLIDDFVVMENNETDIELLLLTKSLSFGSRIMKIIEFPSMKCKYELPIPQHTWLVQQPKSSVNMYYLSGESFNELDLPQEIEMKIMSETQPEERLKKLIYKGRLDEAEEFGKQFNLNLQPICEAKAKKKLLEITLLNENDTDIINEKFISLLEILNSIESNDFFLGIFGFEIPNRGVMNKLLNEILLRLKDQKYHECVFGIKEQLLRLETLDIIDPYECNMQWQKFVHNPNIVKVCMTLFRSDILSACLIWKRHAACIIPYLDVNNILKLLNTIPEVTEAFHIIQWLRYFVPSVLQTHPDAMTLLVDWSIQKTRSLQFSGHWPEVGLEFSTKILSIFDDTQFLYTDIRRQYDTNIDKLKGIVNALQDLSVLKKSYNLILTLDNYIKDALDDTALRILQGVQLSHLKRLTCDFLYPIYLEKGQTPIYVIKKYINYLVTNRKNAGFWLERAVASIDLLHNEEEKLQCALLVLKSSPVPWPESVSPLVKLSSSSHPLAVEIQTQNELQIIKILKGKYDWPSDASDSNMKLVFRIVKVNLPEMTTDIGDLIKVCPEISSSANFYCCYELAYKGHTEKAVKFLDNLEEKQRIECYEKITNILSSMFSNANDDGSHYDNLLEFLKLITPRCNTENRAILLELQHLQILRKKFHLEVEIENLKNKPNRIKILLLGIDFIIKDLKNRKDNLIHHIWNRITELTRILSLEKIFGILEFIKRLNNINLSCALAFYMLNLEEVSSSNYEFYIDFAAILLCQHMESVTREVESHLSDPLTYPLAYKLLIEALKYGKIFQLEIIELLKWIRIGNEMYSLSAVEDYYKDFSSVDTKISEQLNGSENSKQNGTLKSVRRESISIFDNVKEVQENTKPTTDPTPIIRCISLSLLVILLEVNLEELPFRLNLFINLEIKQIAEDVKVTFLTSLEHLAKSKQYSSWYTIVQYLLKLQKHSDVVLVPKNVVCLYKRKMFKFMLSQNEPNYIDLFSMLLSDSNPESCLKYLANELKVGQLKINYLILSEMYNTHIGDSEKISSDRESRMKYFYYTELQKQDSTIKCKTNLDFVSISMLVAQLRNKVLDVSLLKKLSHDFDWDYQQVLVKQVITILHIQEPSYEIKTDALNKEEVLVKTSVEEIRNLCQPYVNEITNTDLLASKLLNFIGEINFYFYEMYLCVIDMLAYINALPKEMELWTNILLFLKHKMITKRRQRAGQMEMDWWLKSQKEVGVLPKIAKYRFPFKPIIEEPLKNILDVEVNVDNCESWFPLIKLHTVLQGKTINSEIVQEQEYFCMSAVKNSISEYKQQNEESDTDVWHLQPINNAFLQSILRLIRHMSHISKILFILYFVTNHAPEGADQVEAAYECYKFAVKNEKSLMAISKAQETVIKIKRKYPIIKTQHLLHIYNLIDERLLQLAESPKDLITALYHHESILKSPKSDINNVASEISKLHNLEFHELQISMLDMWLACTTQADSVDIEETFYEDLNVSSQNASIVNDEFIIRAHYILNSWESSKAIEFLICHMFAVDGVINTGKQLQMFECFSKLIDESSSSYMDIVSQKQYVVLKCVHYLKRLGYNFTVDKFSEYDKLSILTKVWQNHATNPLALEVISYICLGYDIFIPKIWNSVLKQMVNLNMVAKLNALVDILSCKTSLLYTDGLIAAWDCVLREPFKNANRSRSCEQENILAKNLFRIQGCPLVTQLDLIAFAEYCIRLDRPHMASVFLAFSNKKQKEFIIPMIKQHKKENMKKEILDLEEMGISRTIINFIIQQLQL